MEKLRYNHNEDRISGLPEPLLDKILSFLPIKTVVQTCLLSKRWKDLWCSIPYLQFDSTIDDGKHSSKSFENFVDSFFLSRHSSTIQELHLYCRRIPYGRSKFNLWITYAIRHNVQVLDLIFSDAASLQLTPCIFSCASLRELKLNLCCRISLPTSICLPLLDTLHLKFIKFHNDQTFETLVSASTVLETLIVECCEFVDVELLHISAAQLRNLTLKSQILNQTIVSTPRLTSLNILGGLLGDFSFMNDLTSLVHATIHAFIPESYSKCAIELIRVVQPVHSLTLWNPFPQLINNWLLGDSHTEEYIKIIFCNLKCLNLHMRTYVNDTDIRVILTLLKYSPNLQILVLDAITPDRYTDYGISDEEIWMDSILPHDLTSVRLQSFQGCENSVRFVKFLLQKAERLKKLVIIPSNSRGKILVEESEMMRIGEELLLHPHASGSVEITFL